MVLCGRGNRIHGRNYVGGEFSAQAFEGSMIVGRVGMVDALNELDVPTVEAPAIAIEHFANLFACTKFFKIHVSFTRLRPAAPTIGLATQL